jgi:hypothetical protein
VNHKFLIYFQQQNHIFCFCESFSIFVVSLLCVRFIIITSTLAYRHIYLEHLFLICVLFSTIYVVLIGKMNG